MTTTTSRPSATEQTGPVDPIGRRPDPHSCRH